MRNVINTILVAACFACTATQSIAQVPEQWGNLRPGPYKVGFEALDMIDHSRSYIVYNGQAVRPLQVTIWYPAKPKTSGKPLQMRDYFALASMLSIKMVDSNFFRAQMAEYRQGFARSYGNAFNDTVYQSLLDVRTAAYKNAEPADEKFPLIMTGGGGSSALSQSVMHEYLASHGYVVVSFNDLNSSPAFFDRGDDSREALFAKAQDVAFIVQNLAGRKNIDVQNMGYIGFSAPVGVVYHMMSGKLKTLVSLEAFYNEQMTALPYYDIRRINFPVMLARSTESPEFPSFMTDSLQYADRHLLMLPAAGHVDFFQNKRMARPAEAKNDLQYEMIAVYTHNFLDKVLKSSDKAERFIAGNTVADAGTGTDKIRIIRKPAKRAVPTETQFLTWMREGQIDRMVSEHREAKKDNPGIRLFARASYIEIMFHESRRKNLDQLYALVQILLEDYPSEPVAERFVNIIGYNYLQARKGDKAIEVFDLGIKHFPRSPNLYDSKADVYQALGNKEKAKENAQKAIDLLANADLPADRKEAIRKSAQQKLQ